MRLSEHIKSIEQQAEALLDAAKCLRDFTTTARESWPDHQIVGPVEWHSRDVQPPIGWVWASDGLRIWLINVDSTGISSGARAVKFWSRAYIPAPPVEATPC